MKFVVVFTTCLAVALAHTWVPSTYSTVVPVTRDIPWIDAAGRPVNVVPDLTRTIGFDDYISEYANTDWSPALALKSTPIYPAPKSAIVIPSDVVSPYGGPYCHRKPWLCHGLTKLSADIDAPSPIVKSLPYVPEADWPFYKVLDRSYPALKSHYVPLEAIEKEYARTAPIYSVPWSSLKIQATGERRFLKTVPSTVPISDPAVPLVSSKNIPFVKSSLVTVPTVDDETVAKTYPITDTIAASDAEATVIPPYVIRPEHLKSVTVPVLSPVEPTIITSTINSPTSSVIPSSVI